MTDKIAYWCSDTSSQQERDATPAEQAEFAARRAAAPAMYRSAVWERIKDERERRKAGGVLVGEKWFHTDDKSRLSYISIVMTDSGASGIQWKTMDGTFVTMTKSLANEVLIAVSNLDQAAFANAEAHRAALQDADSPLAYDYLSGWPAVYVE